MREKTPQTLRSVQKEGRRCSRCRSRDSPAARGEDHGEADCPPAAQGAPRGSRSLPAAQGGPHAGAGGCPKEAVTLWEARAGAASWQELRPHGERSPRWSRFSGRTCDPVGDPRWSSVCLKDCMSWKGPTLEQLMKNCSLWEGLTLEKFMEDCVLWERPHAGAGEECGESSP